MSTLSHLFWGAITSFVPIIALSLLAETGRLADNSHSCGFIVYLPIIYAMVNLLLQTIIAPQLRSLSNRKWILGAIAGLIYAALDLYGDKIYDIGAPDNPWKLNKPRKLFLPKAIIWSFIYGWVLPNLQRTVCSTR